MYYGHEAGFLRIAEMRHKAAAERRAREARATGSGHGDELPARRMRRARRLWARAA